MGEGTRAIGKLVPTGEQEVPLGNTGVAVSRGLPGTVFQPLAPGVSEKSKRIDIK